MTELTMAVRLSTKNNDFHTREFKNNVETQEVHDFVKTHKKLLNITDTEIKQYSRDWKL